MTGTQSITKIAAALLKAQKKMGDATKSSSNPFFKSSYADLNEIRETVIPVLNSEGITVLQPTVTLGDKNYVETVLLHESGEYIAGLTQIVNVKGDAQSEGSGISYARRYGLQSICNVGAVDDDGEAAQGRKNVSVGKESRSETKNSNTNFGETQKTVQAKTVETKVDIPGGTYQPGAALGNSTTKALIEKSFKVLEMQKKISKEAFKMNYLGNRGLSTVTPSELPGIYEKLKKDFPELRGA